jgi:hypothetical protein
LSKFNKFEDLDIWKIAVSIAIDVYLLCDSEPLKSDYAKGSSGEFSNKLFILSKAGKLDTVVYETLYARSVEFSSKTKSLIDYLKSLKQIRKQNNITTFQPYNNIHAYVTPAFSE